MGNEEIEDALQELDKLTQEEARMASAELLKITHGVDDKLEQANRMSSLNLPTLRPDHSDTLRKPP